MPHDLFRDFLEGMIVFAVGGTLFSAVLRLMRGQIRALMCASCGRPTSRAYLACQRCGAPR